MIPESRIPTASIFLLMNSFMVKFLQLEIDKGPSLRKENLNSPVDCVPTEALNSAFKLQKQIAPPTGATVIWLSVGGTVGCPRGPTVVGAESTVLGYCPESFINR